MARITSYSITSDALSRKYSAFNGAEQQLMSLLDVCFGKGSSPRNFSEHICLILGRSCIEDFEELMLMAEKHRIRGVYKLIRTLYERALTLATIAYIPGREEREQQAIRFSDYQWINWNKISRAAKKVMDAHIFEEAWNSLAPQYSLDMIDAELKRVEPQFTRPRPRTCGCGLTTTSKSKDKTWHKAPGEMAMDLGESWTQHYFNAYTIPNMIIHTTGFDFKANVSRCDGTVLQAMLIMLAVVKAQNFLVELNLYGDIDRCRAELSQLSVQMFNAR